MGYFLAQHMCFFFVLSRCQLILQYIQLRHQTSQASHAMQYDSVHAAAATETL